MTTILPQDMPANKRGWLELFAKIDSQLASLDASLASIGNSITTINNWIAAHDAAWTAYTPTVTPSSGAFGALGTVTGKYKQLGSTVHVHFRVSITTNGTAAGWVNVTLPFTTAAGNTIGIGRETASTGVALTITASGGNCTVQAYNNTYPGGTGYSLWGSLTYEKA